jgi:hypothetical protein
VWKESGLGIRRDLKRKTNHELAFSQKENRDTMVSPNDPPYFEKRESPRTSWMDSDVQVKIISSDTTSKASGWIQDISQGGFKLKTETPPTLSGLFQKWDDIHFETSEDFFQLKGQGKIIWTSSDQNMAGVRIDHLDEESRKYLFGFLGILPLG